MSQEINCKSCEKLIMVDIYEKFEDPRRFYSRMCNKCYEKHFVLVGGK